MIYVSSVRPRPKVCTSETIVRWSFLLFPAIVQFAFLCDLKHFFIFKMIVKTDL